MILFGKLHWLNFAIRPPLAKEAGDVGSPVT